MNPKPEKPISHSVEEKILHPYTSESTKIISKSTKDANLDLELSKIKNANPYAGNPYDRVVQAKYIFNDICAAMIEIGVYSPKELETIYTKENLKNLITKITTEPAFADLGVYSDFTLSKICALNISRETKKLIETSQAEIQRRRISKGSPCYLIFLESHFYILRHIYINLGKLRALFAYFEKNAKPRKNTDASRTTSSSVEYLSDVKKILLDLLREQANSHGKKFKTIPKGIDKIHADFSKEYEALQTSTKYKTTQKFFKIENLADNIRKWGRNDRVFAEALFDFIG